MEELNVTLNLKDYIDDDQLMKIARNEFVRRINSNEVYTKEIENIAYDAMRRILAERFGDNEKKILLDHVKETITDGHTLSFHLFYDSTEYGGISPKKIGIALEVAEKYINGEGRKKIEKVVDKILDNLDQKKFEKLVVKEAARMLADKMTSK